MSDFDLHILIDFNNLENRELLRTTTSEIKSLEYDSQDFTKRFEVEIYIQDSNEPHYSGGEYSNE